VPDARWLPGAEVGAAVWDVLGVSPTAILVIGADGHVEWCNDACADLLGSTRDVLVGALAGVEGLPPALASMLAQGGLAGGDTTVEEVLQLSSGVPVTVAVRGLPDGRGWLVTITEVDGGRVLEAAEERFRAAFATAAIGLAIGTVEGVVIDANPALCRIVARPRSAIVGGSFDALRDPAEGPPADISPLTAGDVDSLELGRHLLRPDGTKVPVRITLSMLGQGSGGDARVVALIEDISAQRAAEEARRHAERRFRAMFEHAPIGQAIATLGGEIVSANDALARLLGRSLDDLEGRHLSTFTHPDDIGTSLEALARLREGVGHAELEKRYVRPDGEVVHASVSLGLGPAEGGRPANVLALVQDITERTRAVAQLGQTLAALEERNADLQHFASVASHDLKAPLQTVRGFLELAQREAEAAGQDDVAHYVSRALAGTNRMRALIDSLLAFARSGTAALAPEDVPVVDVLERVTRSIGSVVDDHVASIAVDDHVDQVHADPASLEVLLQNLVSNAVQHAGAGTAIRVSTRAEDGGVTLRVSDDGPGIAVADRERVFSMFEQGPGRRGSAGIGLATCARIVDRHGGRIWIEDAPTGGATVAAWFPSPSSGT
jgi:PAS domain S-box-containing protein